MFGKRSDGVVAKDIDPILRFTSAAMQHRYDAMVNYLLEAHCDGIDKFIKEEGEKGNSINYMHIVIAAIIRTYAERPELNRFIMNTKVFNRNKIEFCFAVKKSLRDDADETIVKLEFDGTENIYQIKEKIDKGIKENKGSDKENDTDNFARMLLKCPPFILKSAMCFIRFLDRHGMLPKSVIKISPFHTSCFLTNMKSISTEYVYHHLYDLGTTGMFIGMGKEVIKPVIAEDGSIEKAKILQLGIVIDERICDGFYYAKSIKLFKRYLLHPEALIENYVLPEKKLTKKELKKQQKQTKKADKKLRKENLKKERQLKKNSK